MLKQYLSERKSCVFYDQIYSQLPYDFFYDYKEFTHEIDFKGYQKVGSCKWNKDNILTVDLDLDLMDMLMFDPWLGENLIKCLFRYYSLLPEYVKNIFVEMYEENNQIIQNESEMPKLDKIVNRMKNEIKLKVNLKLTHFPYSFKRIDHKVLLNNNLLVNHG